MKEDERAELEKEIASFPKLKFVNMQETIAIVGKDWRRYIKVNKTKLWNAPKIAQAMKKTK